MRKSRRDGRMYQDKISSQPFLRDEIFYRSGVSAERRFLSFPPFTALCRDAATLHCKGLIIISNTGAQSASRSRSPPRSSVDCRSRKYSAWACHPASRLVRSLAPPFMTTTRASDRFRKSFARLDAAPKASLTHPEFHMTTYEHIETQIR